MRGFIQIEAWSQQCCIHQQPYQILDSLIRLILITFLLQFLHNGVVGVDFHGLLRSHISGHARISQSLSFHNSFHIRWPAVLASHQNARGLWNSGSNKDFLNLLSQDFLDQLAQWLIWGLLFFQFLLFFFIVFKVQTFLGAVFQLLSIEIFQLLNNIFINGINHIDHLNSLLLQAFNEWRIGNRWFGFSSDEVNILLSLFHSSYIVFKADLIFTRFGGIEPQEFSQFLSIGLIFVYP